MLTTGLLGAISTTSAVAIASTHAGGRLGRVGADEHEPVGGHVTAVADPPLLEVDRLALAVDVDHHVRLEAVVGRRSMLRPGFQRSHNAAVTWDSGKPAASIWGAYEMGGDVLVAQRPNHDGSTP